MIGHALPPVASSKPRRGEPRFSLLLAMHGTCRRVTRPAAGWNLPGTAAPAREGAARGIPRCDPAFARALLWAAGLPDDDMAPLPV